MGIIVSCVSQKGGVGKSTIAAGLATGLTTAGLYVKIADLDTQQGSSLDWGRRRLNNSIDPGIEVQAFPSAAQALTKANDYDVLIIDGPARTNKSTLEISKASKLIIQPTAASLADLIPGIKEFNALVQAGIQRDKLRFALNHISTDAEVTTSRAYIEQAGYRTLDGFLPERSAYKLAMNEGRSILETRFASLNSQAEIIIQSIVNLLR